MDSVTSTRGKNKLIDDGYVYVKQNYLANGVVSYEGKHSSGQCKAKVKVLNGAIIANTTEHTHAPVVGRAEVLHVRASNKQFILYTIVFLYPAS